MRLRAEYQFAARQFSQILFKDNDGKAYIFNPPYTRENFDRYLERVFWMCGTASLSNSLKPVNFADIRPGDVIVHGGFPGHAVMVMDLASNPNGEKIYLLAQSYMPAQNIQLLQDGKPWFTINAYNELPCGGLVNIKYLRRF